MNNMKDLNNKTFIATVCTMVILCIVCQFTALQVLKPNDKNKQSLAQENAAISGSETAATSSTEAPNDSNKRKLKLKYRKLRRLENQSDFLEFTSKELEIVTLFKRHENSSYYNSIVMIDLDAPNPLEKARKFVSKREEYMQNALDDMEDFVNNADYSCLTAEEYKTFTKYVEARRRWAEIVYDDYVDNETKLETCKAWADVWDKVWEIADKMYKAKYGNSYEGYKAVYDSSGIDSIISYTNPWWINRTVASYRDEDGNLHHLRIKLFKE